MELFLIAILSLLIYFIPTMVADLRRHKDISSIAIINMLLGWTLVGWVVALAWAFKK